VGDLLGALEEAGLAENTVILYTSDHGEMAGRKGLWQKMCFYEPSARVPLIVRGLGWPRGCRIAANVSLIDILPTLIELAGEQSPAELPGTSILSAERMDKEGDERTVFGEYHGQGSERASFMIRKGNYKYVYYLDWEPQLFDLTADPQENEDLAGQGETETVQKQLQAELLRIADPQTVDALARSNQKLFGLARAH
jgi:choline-sulfatase